MHETCGGCGDQMPDKGDAEEVFHFSSSNSNVNYVLNRNEMCDA